MGATFRVGTHPPPETTGTGLNEGSNPGRPPQGPDRRGRASVNSWGGKHGPSIARRASQSPGGDARAATAPTRAPMARRPRHGGRPPSSRPSTSNRRPRPSPRPLRRSSARRPPSQHRRPRRRLGRQRHRDHRRHGARLVGALPADEHPLLHVGLRGRRGRERPERRRQRRGSARAKRLRPARDARRALARGRRHPVARVRHEPVARPDGHHVRRSARPTGWRVQLHPIEGRPRVAPPDRGRGSDGVAGARRMALGGSTYGPRGLDVWPSGGSYEAWPVQRRRRHPGTRLALSRGFSGRRDAAPPPRPCRTPPTPATPAPSSSTRASSRAATRRCGRSR